MKLWIDDVRPNPDPENYVWCDSVNRAKWMIEYCELCANDTNPLIVETYTIKLIDIDHDAGEHVNDGGDFIKLLDWLEETGRNYPIRIHSMNPVGVENMRRIIQRNGWVEVR